VNIDILKSELANHPDTEFVDYLVNGLTEGFDTGVRNPPTASLVCHNLLSARTQPDIVDSLLQIEVNKGYLLGPYTIPPFPYYRCSPIGIVEKKYSTKRRLIVDLSAPHDSPNAPSINELINKDDFSLSYVKIDDAIIAIKNAGVRAQLCKTDIVDAFKLMPIHPSLWHLYGVHWNNEYFFFMRLAFGCRSSPKIFDQLSSAICWIAENNYGIKTIFHLLDDFLTVDLPSFDAERTMAI
jgi:hypothetical protein